LYLLANIFFNVPERVERGRNNGDHPGGGLKLCSKLLIFECQHPAIGVIDHDEFLRSQQIVRNEQ
jgi:hypothetical protein